MLEEDALGVAPGQTACLMDGDLVVGHGTIAASSDTLKTPRDGGTTLFGRDP